MPVSSEDFLRFSKEECIQSDSEIGFRNAISRAYYSMFHHARSVLKNGPVDPQSPHKKLIDYLLSPDSVRLEGKESRDLRKMASMLLQRRSIRNLADYDLTKSFSCSDAQEAIEVARLFIEHCDAMANDNKCQVKS